MTGSLVPTVRTHQTPAQVYAALETSWRTLLDTTPTRESLLVLLSQWSLETGGGGESMNWNLGGIKHEPGDGHDYATYNTHEVVHGVDTVLPQNFRAYANLNEAAFDYLRTLRNHFAFAWPAVEVGNAADFAHRLKVGGYYTAPEADYAAGLRARYAQLDKVIPPGGPEPFSGGEFVVDNGEQPTPPGDLKPPDDAA